MESAELSKTAKTARLPTIGILARWSRFADCHIVVADVPLSRLQLVRSFFHAVQHWTWPPGSLHVHVGLPWRSFAAILHAGIDSHSKNDPCN